MDFTNFQCTADDDNRRLDKILRKLLPTKKLSELYQAIRKGLVRVNDLKVKTDCHVANGDTVNIATFLLETNTSQNTQKEVVQSSFIDFPVIFQNEHISIINKPYDMSVQGNASIAQQLLAQWNAAAKNTTSLSFHPAPLHRLDKKTTGVLVCSQSLAGSQWFTKALAEHRVQKTYIAIAQGYLDKACTWQDCIELQEEKNSTAFHTVKISNTGKTAITHATPLTHGSYNGQPVTLIQYHIETGRKHQIRAQSAHHGHPLLGDSAYGGLPIKESQDIYLHAYQITIPSDNPVGLPEVIQAPILTNFKKMLNKTLLKWNGLLIV